MASSSDVKDILGGQESASLESPLSGGPVTRDVLLSRALPQPKPGRLAGKPLPPSRLAGKRPKGMARELWGLISADSDTATLVPSDTAYKQPRARLGPARVRQWRWTPFRNSARGADQLELCHWRRVCDPAEDYSFAKFNRLPDVPGYSTEEYGAVLEHAGWTEPDTAYLLAQLRRYNLRFVIALDRWDTEQHGDRSLEDLKERFYGLCQALAAHRAAAAGQPPPRPNFVYDAEHERRRREQLGLLLGRTREQVAEEERLRLELAKIEQRRQDREKKTVHLQRLISQADAVAGSRPGRPDGGPGGSSRRSLHAAAMVSAGSSVGTPLGSGRRRALAAPAAPLEGLRFQEARQAGASLRSSRIRLPQLLGQKKAKTLDGCLEDLRVDANPIPTEEIADEFNQLRSEILLYSELRTHLQALDYEFQTLKHRYEQLSGRGCPVHWEPYRGRSLGAPAPSGPGTRKGGASAVAGSSGGAAAAAAAASASTSPTAAAGTPSPTRHKRQAAIGQEQMMKKLKTVGMGRFSVTS